MSATALLLPGQGSQYVGMGRDLASSFHEARRAYEEADDVLGVPLSRISWEGPEEQLRRTENAQPAILTHSYATWSVLPSEVRDSIVVAAGHSLGEFSAYLLAGSFAFEDALRVVRRRGELMAASGDMRPGAMAAVIGLSAEVVSQVCARVEHGTVVPANYNTPDQVVISGDQAAVEEAQTNATAAGARRVLPLNVSGAFHSPLMEVARLALQEALEGTELRDPRFPVVANASAEPVSDGSTARELLVAQLTSPVRWVDDVRTMNGFSPRRWLEVGPGKVLSGLLRRIDRTLEAKQAGDVPSVAALGEKGEANSGGT